MEVAQSASTAFEQHHHLSVVHHVADEFARFGIIHHCSARHIDIHILAVGSVALVSSTVSAMLGEHVALVFQVQQGPVVVVSAQVDVASASAVATVGTAIRVVLHAPKVHRSPSALTRAAVNLNVVYKV